SCIVRYKSRRRLDAAVHRLWLALPAENDLPDVLQGGAAIGRKSDVGFRRIRPNFAEVIARAQISPPEAMGGRPQAMPPFAMVVRERIDGLAVEIGASHFPPGTFRR